MSELPREPYEYKVGGSLSADSPTYVVRAVDDELYEALRNRQLCYILNARQMGKSSLRVRAQNRLVEEGIACADVDLSLSSGEGVTAEQWYAGVADSLVSRFELYQDFDLSNWWTMQGWIPPAQRLGKFFEEVLLARVPGDLVLFFEEIDSVLGLSFRDDFFALLRSFHERRTSQPALHRLTFVLVGVATPSELIRRSSFNIGRAIDLKGFGLDEAMPLLPGLKERFADPETVLREILAWTGGQPFLTQKLCRLAVSAPSVPVPGEERRWVEDLVQTRIVADWQSQDEPPHLRPIRDRLLDKDSGVIGRLGLYQRTLENKGDVTGGETPESVCLRLSGLVVECHGKLQVANPIYAAVFGPEWVTEKLAELRPYAPALAAWLASDRTDSSCLLSGEALASAGTWAADKSLSNEDYQFLEASARQAEKQANQLLTQARKKAWRITAVGSMVFVITVIASLLMLLVLWQQTRSTQETAQKELDRVAGERADLERQIEALKLQQSRLVKTIEKTEIQGEAESYLQAIGQRPDYLPPAELKVFQRLAGSSEDVRLDFLRRALATEETAERLSHRLAISSHATLGVSQNSRERILGEIVIPCLRQRERPFAVQRLCAELGLELGIFTPELTRFFLGLARSSTGTHNLLDTSNTVDALARLSRTLPPDQVPGIFALAVEIIERVAGTNEPRSHLLREWCLRSLGEMADHLPRSAQARALRTTFSALVRTEGKKTTDRDIAWEFWTRSLLQIPGELPPQIRREAFTLEGMIHSLASKVRPDDAPAAFQQVVEVATRSEAPPASPYDEALVEIARKLTPETADAILLDYVARTLKEDCPRKWWPLNGVIAATARRATLPAQGRALDQYLRDTEAVPATKQEIFPGLECWALPLKLIPGRLKTSHGRELMDQMIELMGEGKDVGNALPLIAGRIEAAEADTILLGALTRNLNPNQIQTILEALGSLPGRLSPDASKLVVARVLDALEAQRRTERSLLISQNENMTRANRDAAARIMNEHLFDLSPMLVPVASRFDPETSREIKDQVLEILRKMENTIGPEGMDDFQPLEGIRILAALPGALEKADTIITVWPIILGEALSCKWCYEVAEAIKLMPDSLGASGESENLYLSHPAAHCNSIFAVILPKVRPDSRKLVVDRIFSDLESTLSANLMRCLLAGLAAQPSDLEPDQIRSALMNLSKVSYYFGLTEGDRSDLKKVWIEVAQRIKHSGAHKSLRTLTDIWGEETDPRNEWAVLALPAVAGRVLPQHSREVFLALSHASSLGHDLEANQALAESLAVLRGKIPPRDLFDFLQQPQCVGVLRSATLARLERETGRKFNGSLWKAVEWARTPGVDLLKPTATTSR